MTAEQMRHLFDPFHSTKNSDNHLGLGLFVSTKIVQQHGGDLLVESQPGAGSTITVVLPWSVACRIGRNGMNASDPGRRDERAIQ